MGDPLKSVTAAMEWKRRFGVADGAARIIAEHCDARIAEKEAELSALQARLAWLEAEKEETHNELVLCDAAHKAVAADLAEALGVVRAAKYLLDAHTAIVISEREQEVIGNINALIAKYGGSNGK